MTSPIDIKYMNPTAMIQVESIVMDLDVDIKKLEVLLFPIGWRIAETNFNSKLNTTISSKGESIVVIIIKTPTSPTAFFINMVLDKIISIPSDKYPPIIGI